MRVLDSRRRTLSTATLRFSQPGRRTLTLKPRRRGRAATLTLTWTPRDGAAQTRQAAASARRLDIRPIPSFSAAAEPPA